MQCNTAFPCATQNEISTEDAKTWVLKGANMPTEPAAVHLFQESDVLFGPAKAANAGGVAVSGLEQSQNSLRLSWSREEVDERLKEIIKEIHGKCLKYGGEANGKVDYVKGANIGGFVKVPMPCWRMGSCRIRLTVEDWAYHPKTVSVSPRQNDGANNGLGGSFSIRTRPDTQR